MSNNSNRVEQLKSRLTEKRPSLTGQTDDCSDELKHKLKRQQHRISVGARQHPRTITLDDGPGDSDGESGGADTAGGTTTANGGDSRDDSYVGGGGVDVHAFAHDDLLVAADNVAAGQPRQRRGSLADQGVAGHSIWSVLPVPETAGTAADSVDVRSKVYSEHTDPMSGSIYKFNNHTGSSHWLHALLPPVNASLKNDEPPMSPRLAGTGVGAVLSTLADESAPAAAREGGLPPPLFLAPTVSVEVEAPMTASRASTPSHPTTLSHSHSPPTLTTPRARAATVRRGSVSEMVNPLLSAKKSSLRRLNKKYTSSRGEKVSVTEKEDGIVHRLGSEMIEKQPPHAMRPRTSSINLLGTAGNNANMDERRAAAEARAAAVGRGSTIDGEGVGALFEGQCSEIFTLRYEKLHTET